MGGTFLWQNMSRARGFEGVQSNNGKLMVWGPVVWIPKGSPYERVWDSWGYPFQKIPNHSWPQTSRPTIIVDTGMSWSIIFCLCWTFTGAKLIGFSNLWWPFFVMNRKAPETSIKTDKSIILRPFWLMWTDNPPPNMAKKSFTNHHGVFRWARAILSMKYWLFNRDPYNGVL